MKLRYYQTEAVDAVFEGWKNKIPGNYVIQLPTGAGKSVVIAELVKRLYTLHKARILMLVHTRELVRQNAEKLVHLWPEAPIGIYSAGLNKKELHEPIVFASIQSIGKQVHKRDAFDIVIIDEAHCISEDEESVYLKTINTLKMMNPFLKIIGTTATPYRMGTGMITNGIFDTIIYEAEISKLIKEGYLSNLTTKSGTITIDTKGVSKRGGEYLTGQLESRAMEGDTTGLAVSDMVKRGADRKCWIVFAVGIKHAQQITQSLKDHGIVAEMLTGQTPKGERDRIIEDHKSGNIRCLVNIATLTTGYDNPKIDMIGLMRPTESPGLYYQMVGRGLRIADNKLDCLILDYSGACLRHGPIDALKPKRSIGSGDGIAPAKECPNYDCMAIIHASLRHCPYCGYEFPPPEIEIHHRAIKAPILKSQVVLDEIIVHKTSYKVHKKPGRPDSVRIIYESGLMSINEWIFPESGTQAGLHIYDKFCLLSGITQTPRSAAEFVELNPRGPKKIWVLPDGKYFKVVGREY